MGVINQGILGGFSGKVGPVVGGKWKDVDYMRSYVIPANPNTAGQQAVRSKFSALVALSKQILTAILQAFWDPHYSDMSGYNAWISKNYPLSDGDGVIDSTAIMSEGGVEGFDMLACTYNTATGQVIASWADNSGVNGALNTDVVNFVFLDNDGQQLHPITTSTQRDAEESTNSIADGLVAADVTCFAFLKRGTGNQVETSTSEAVACTAA